MEEVTIRLDRMLAAAKECPQVGKFCKMVWPERFEEDYGPEITLTLTGHEAAVLNRLLGHHVGGSGPKHRELLRDVQQRLDGLGAQVCPLRANAVKRYGELDDYLGVRD